MLQLRTETISVTTNKRRTVDEDKHIIHEGTHEPIISLETFKTVEMMLKKSKANMRKEAERGPAGQYSPGFLFSILGPVLY